MTYVVKVNDAVVDAPCDYTRAWSSYAAVRRAVGTVAACQVFAEPVTVYLEGGPTREERAIIDSQAFS